ncbi:hypothetical protein CEXT_638741 [Caerostris extrusa]|uniref:Uncharacterized protein n=1 Tax=Caerostris extrusa TaxID=172846 RepID=A0AAV4XJ92_CAEEX|nr:hypothetical protein CEXT_638741 [Caerostris extrusa]
MRMQETEFVDERMRGDCSKGGKKVTVGRECGVELISSLTTHNFFGENFKILACKKNRATSLLPIIGEDGRVTNSIKETQEAILSFHFPSVARNETTDHDSNRRQGRLQPHHIT